MLRAAHPLPDLDLRCNWAKRGGSQAGQEEPPSHPPIWHPTPQTSGNEMVLINPHPQGGRTWFRHLGCWQAYEVWTVERAPFLSLVRISFSRPGDVTSPLRKREETGEVGNSGRDREIRDPRLEREEEDCVFHTSSH